MREGITHVTNKSNTNKSIANVMNNETVTCPHNDTDDNKSSDVQEEEEKVKEKIIDMDNNHKFMSNDSNHNVMLFAYISCKCVFELIIS